MFFQIRNGLRFKCKEEMQDYKGW